MDVDRIVAMMNEHAPHAMQKLGGRIHSYDEASESIELRFNIDETFCHSGDIVQGGFVAGMLDASMAHVVFAKLREFVVLATLEIKVSYYDIARPGELRASGRIEKLGKSIAFLAAELHSESGELLAAATSTAKVISKRPQS